MMFNDKISQKRIAEELKAYNELERQLHENKPKNIKLEILNDFKK